ncbi:hypothetical protein SAMN05421823_101505 [Catalinimonas alkaloidigena]|uniref:Uncharacterized protein n=1 Tax=Catalinimonas alkaloidigena TaxID=1075417 RepID=A0A1G8XXP1_9BACT|nr:hypothetical protein [Catalinimonas alkaloidigena]SDJ95246.1 hypothetical protein SAMN05421823_101505 [Catalinimonas alkaloidigena]
MQTVKIISYALLVVAIGMGYYLFTRIKGPIDELNHIQRVEGQIIAKLKVIREAEKAYFNKYAKYAGSCDQLMNFIQNEQIYRVARKETIIEREAYLGDSIVVELDTLGSIAVRDSLFTPETLPPGVTLNNLCRVPGSSEQFKFYAGEVQRTGGYILQVVEVADPSPINPERVRGPKEPLKFGSQSEVTTSGNWE